MTFPISQNAYAIGSGTTSTNSLLTAFFPRDPTAQDVNFQATQRWVNTVTNAEWYLDGFISSNGVMTGNWKEISRGASASLNTITGSTGGAVSGDANGNINLLGTNVSVTGNPSTNTLTIAATGTGLVSTLTGNSGGAISPTANNINTLGTGSITIVGSGSTLTTELTSLTNHNVLVGAGTATITNVAPSATSGVPLISQGSSSDPAFGTAVVAGGGTGKTSFTAYSVITAGTTATGAFQNVSGVGTSGQILTSNGASALPTWQSYPAGSVSVNIQTFTTTSTYTPTSGMVYCIIEALGGGGAGGGTLITDGSHYAAGGGGAGGEYAKGVFSASTIGASQSVTIGGAGAASSGAAGGNGGNTSVGSIISANGGHGGDAGVGIASNTAGLTAGGVGGTGGSGGNVRTPGVPGFAGLIIPGFFNPAAGASSQYGAGGAAYVTGAGFASSNNAAGYGAGGSGAIANINTAAQGGGNGSAGLVVITEFV